MFLLANYKYRLWNPTTEQHPNRDDALKSINYISQIADDSGQNNHPDYVQASRKWVSSMVVMQMYFKLQTSETVQRQITDLKCHVQEFLKDETEQARLFYD